MRERRERTIVSAGQSTVELLAAVPLVALVGLICLQGLIAGAISVQADNAAHAAAVAWAHRGESGTDAAAAARAALPGWARGRVRVRTTGNFIRVTLRPRTLIPGLGLEWHARSPLPVAEG